MVVVVDLSVTCNNTREKGSQGRPYEDEEEAAVADIVLPKLQQGDCSSDNIAALP